MTTSTPQLIEFDGLRIAFDHRVLRPRPWTVAQSRWAAELLAVLPAGPVLELCTGAGQIGLAAIRRTDRTMVCVDADPVAAGFARANARDAGLEARVQVRVGRLDDVLDAGERFSLVIADPPWVVHDRIGTFPEDPPLAIDGGADGLHVARRCLGVAARHLVDGGELLLQLGSTRQVTELLDAQEAAGLTCREFREYDGGVVARFSR
jgi:release factor glutamine methyltransferase